MFKKMDYIYAIYKTGSFSKAAEQLFISQPALSIAVRKLEDELGQKLFFRTTGTVELTEAGKAYIDKCEKIRHFEQELTEYFNELDGLLTGELSIGGANISMNYILPDIITAFSAAYPGIRITLREDSTISLKRLLADEALDFVIDSNNFTDGDFDVNTLFTNRILLAVPSQYALSPSEIKPLNATALTAEDIANGRHWDPNITPLPIEAIGDAPFLALFAETEIFMRFQKICETHHFTPNTIMTFNQQFTAYQFAKKGSGITVIGDTVVRLAPDDGSMRYYTLASDDDLCRREIVIAGKRKAYRSKAAETFKQFVVDRYTH
ncbi:MAG: LysR family transcriptional regulator [Veillonella sp.]|nr:LysR family transcriptional regulator [Veillonella sp.]